MKKTLSTFILTLSALAAVWAQTFTVDNLTYEVKYETPNTVKVTGYENTPTGTLNIPAAVTYEGTQYTVTHIEEYAFYECEEITEICLPNSVTNIGNAAFSRCYALTQFNVESENTVYSSEDGVLFNKNKTTLLHYPSSKAASSYNVPDGVITIGNYAFHNSKALTQITLPNSVVNIGEWAFDNCDILQQITMGNSVSTIGYGAFQSCDVLTQVTLPESMTTIDGWAFGSCQMLTQINLPNSITTIGEYAFSGCSALTQITLPNSMTTIENWTFGSCGTLTQVVIPNSITTIKDGAFYGCYSLVEAHLPNSITSIGNTAFYRCSSLEQINIPEGITSIKQSTFYYCHALTQLTLPGSITRIGQSAFTNCSAITQITSLATVPPTVERNAFKNINRDIPVYVPAEAVEAYRTADTWREFTKLQAIGGTTNLQTATMPESIRMEGGMLHNPQGLHLTLYDMQGRQVYSGTDATLSLTAGVYVMRCNGTSCKVLF